MIGFAAIFLALVATAIAAFCYTNAYLASSTRRRETAGGDKKARLAYQAAAAGIIVAAGYLFYLLLSDNFRYAYVFGHSSRDLGLAYKFSAFWAGQEGSFLLWAVFHACFGLLLARRDIPGGMAAYCGLQLMLLTALLAKSPFMALAEPRLDGVGLNPLLQDPWMVIHPPVIFLGYAALAVPFAYAIDGLLTARHKATLEGALPWTLFAFASLGAGIFIGGFWAYKVLGWGGYWAWDPVENSSLVPWLACGALLHMLLLARVRAAAIKSAYFAAVMTFVLVMYGTFLTRSGVLSDFSTHSFTDEGVGGLLASFVLITAAAALVLLILRWPRLPEGELIPAVKSREFGLTAGALTLAAMGVIVLVGMSTPLITMLLGAPQNVAVSFYNITTLPLAVLMAVLIVLGSLAGWGRDNASLLARYRWWLLLVAHGAMIPAFRSGITNPFALAAAGAAVAAVAASLLAAKDRLVSRPAALTHAGVGMALIGIIFSSLAGESVIVSFTAGTSQEVLGTRMTYVGASTDAGGKAYRQQFTLDDQPGATLVPVTKLNKEGRPSAREPGIHRGLTADLYLAPVTQQEETAFKEFALKKGEQRTGDGLAVRFIRYGMAGGGASGDVRVYALLEIARDGAVQEARPELVSRGGQLMPVAVKVFDRYEVALSGINTGEGLVELGLRDMTAPPPAERVSAEVSRKPLINLVWLGVGLITLGTYWAGWARRHTAAAVAETAGGRPAGEGARGEGIR